MGECVTLFTDEDVNGVRCRDPAAVSRVYVALADRLLGYLMARVHDRSAAEDLLEGTFIELMERGHTIRGGPEVLKAWLFRAAHYNALDWLRRRGRDREDSSDELVGVDIVDLHDTPEEEVLRDALAGEVRAALRELSDLQQQVLLLRYVAGLSAPEVGDVLGKSPVAVRGLQHRGERALARILAHRDPSLPVTASRDETSQG